MRFASQFLSEAMRIEVLVSDLMSDCALVSVFEVNLVRLVNRSRAVNDRVESVVRIRVLV